MAEQELFGELAVIGGLAVVTTVGLSRIGLPPTIGFLTTGAIAGPYGVGLVSDTEQIEQMELLAAPDAVPAPDGETATVSVNVCRLKTAT